MAGKRRAATAPKRSRLTGRPKKVRPKNWRTRTLAFLKWSFVTGLVLALLGAVGLVVAYKMTDLPDPNKDFLTQTTYVYYDGGKDQLGEFAIQQRTPLTFEQEPQLMKDAVVAAENESFWTDSGISPKGILRAAFSNAQGNSTQGGSTITQQYVKILYLNQERSYKRKLNEALLSVKIKREFSKQEVLTGYLNTIYFGRGAYGVQAAAQAYFGVDASDLDLKQTAVLASVLNNPSGLDPANGAAARKALKERYRYVLDRMVVLGQDSDPNTVGITEAQATRAKKRLPVFPKLAEESSKGGQKGFMLDMVKQAVLGLRGEDGKRLVSESELEGGGLQITTTLRPQDMQAAADGVKEARPEGFGDKQLHVAVASVEPGTGALRGFYAGQDYLQSEINWAVAGGQAGSTFKPFALAAGLKAGYSLKDTFDGNNGLDIGGGTVIRNEQDTSYGTVDLIKAMEDSINTAFVDLTTSIPDGPEKIIDTAEAMGIPPREAPKGGGPGFPDHTPGLDPYPTVTLGPQTVSPINMASAYATLANNGVAAQPFLIDKIVGPDGTVIYQHQVVTEKAISPDISADVSYTLQRNVLYGTGAKAQALGRESAGKTGTATNDKDQVSSAWFAGYTPQMSTAVMYVRGDGNDQLDGWLPSYFGADYPTETWLQVMKAEMAGLPEKDFPPPAYVDGTPPQTGHTPQYTPSATSTGNGSGGGPKRPPRNTATKQPTQQPTKQPTTSSPTQAPTTPGCGLLGCSTSQPPSSPPPSSPEPSPSGPASGGGDGGGGGGGAGVQRRRSGG